MKLSDICPIGSDLLYFSFLFTFYPLHSLLSFSLNNYFLPLWEISSPRHRNLDSPGSDRDPPVVKKKAPHTQTQHTTHPGIQTSFDTYILESKDDEEVLLDLTKCTLSPRSQDAGLLGPVIGGLQDFHPGPTFLHLTQALVRNQNLYLNVGFTLKPTIHNHLLHNITRIYITPGEPGHADNRAIQDQIKVIQHTTPRAPLVSLHRAHKIQVKLHVEIIDHAVLQLWKILLYIFLTM